MDSIVLTALIAGGSAVAGSAVAAIGATLTARSNTQQTRAKVAADHAAWLRGKRSEIYVEVGKFVRDAAWRRVDVIKDGPVATDLRERALREIAQFTSTTIAKLSADGTTFLGQEIASAFDNAAIANMQTWKLFLEAVERIKDIDTGGHIELNSDIHQALDRAKEADREVYLLIRLDISWTDYDRKYLRTRKRARRRQIRQFRKLEERNTKCWGLP